MYKIVLYLMTYKGFVALKEIHKELPNIIEYVVIGQDKNIKNDFAKEIKDFCIENNTVFFFRGDEPKLNHQTYVLAFSWRWMLEHPKTKLVIFHDSLLPKYRGFSPLVNMLINGEKTIGYTALHGDKGYDQGNIIAQSSSQINYPIKINEAIHLNLENLKSVIRSVLEQIIDLKKLKSVPQDETKATYSIWRDGRDYFIDWNLPSVEIKRFVDAVGSPYEGAKAYANDDVILIEDVEVVKDKSLALRHVGKVLFSDDGFPVVICGEGLIKIKSAKFLESDALFLPIKKFRTRFS